MNEEQIEKSNKNIKEFFEEKGKEGFLKLFFTEYLYEFVMLQIRSGDKTTKEDRDGGLIYHFDEKSNIIKSKDESKFKKELKKECYKKAEDIVVSLRKKGILSQLEPDKFEDPKIKELVRASLKKLIKDLFKTKWMTK